MNTYSFVPNPQAVKMFKLKQPLYTGANVALLLKEALGFNNFKKFVFRQELIWIGHKAKVFAFLNPNEKNPLKLMCNIVQIGEVCKD